MGQDWIDFEKFIWSLICSNIIVVVEMYKISDRFKLIHRNEPKTGVAKIKLFEKYDLSVGFYIIPINMKSANTT